MGGEVRVGDSHQEERLAALQRVFDEQFEAGVRVDPELVRRHATREMLESEIFLVGQALARDTQRLSGLPYVFPGGPPHRLSRGGKVLDRWLEEVGYTIDPDDRDRSYAYHTDLHLGFPGRLPTGGDVVPSAAEVAAGAEWLRAALQIVDPKAVIGLGRAPALEVLRRYGGIERRRLGEVTGERWQIDVAGRPACAFAAFHPSGAFQLPRQSEEAWAFVVAALPECGLSGGRMGDPTSRL